MIYFDQRRKMLMESEYSYQLQERDDPYLYREMFPYTEIPKTTFNNRVSPVDPPDEIWITDTTFRDGQQSRAPYTPEQIATIYKLLNKLGGPKGIIRQTEFFLYSKTDINALRLCQDLNLPFPEITGWIRATHNDFELAKGMGLKECGILVSCSDYHIFSKLKKNRKQAMDDYLGIIKDALETGIRARCHLEDITRADFYGFVIPFVTEINKLSHEIGIPIKIRACDTLGYGVPYPGASMPRSIPGIIYGLRNYAGLKPEQLEWHGHNDFYKAVVGSATAWLYGASGVNCSLLGIGERTGNTPLEAMVIEYAQLRGTLDGMDTTVIKEIADYYENELGYVIPPKTPFVGSEFNVTQAGIHADGLLKDEEIYNIFDTTTLLNSPPTVAITSTSGAAGIAMWLGQNVFIGEKIEKTDERVLKLKAWVDAQYEAERVTTIGSVELMEASKNLGIV
ncbi:MAG: 2-isopropylmalate synthase [Oscillospiraceae bacterium]|nr:2-isopropylmalate synthase [Oscillospiraceae bacterium]